MNGTKFRDVIIGPDSYQHDDLPGVWWPHSSLRDSESLKELDPVAHSMHARTLEEADAMAMQIAIKRVLEGIHR